MRLDELIANTQPLPYKWIEAGTATFECNGTPFIIKLQSFTPILVTNRTMRGINISFGVSNQGDMNTELTGMNKPRTIIATVAHAVIEKLKSVSAIHNYIVIAAKADSAVKSRAKVYRAAIIDVADKIEQTGFEYPYDVIIDGSPAMLISRVELTEPEVNYLVAKINENDSG